MDNDNIRSVLHLYEDGAFGRRELLQRLAKYTGSLASAAAIVDSAGFAQAQTGCPADVRVSADDPDIEAYPITLWGEGGTLYAYQAFPKTAVGKQAPAVIVIHENRGLTDYIMDVTRRVAKAGFIGLGLDLLSRQGGTSAFPDPEAAGAAYSRTRPLERREDINSALLTLLDQKYVTPGKVGIVGFCAGGGNVLDVVVNTDKLAAAVVFYGTPAPPADQFARVNAPLMGIFGELDRGVTGQVPAILTVLNDNRKNYELHIYEGTNHAFHNDTGPRYDQAAACDAWAKTIAFFRKHLA